MKVSKPTTLPMKATKIAREVLISTQNLMLLVSLVRKKKAFLNKEVRKITVKRVKLRFLTRSVTI